MSSPCSARGTCPFLCPWSAFYLFSTAHLCTCTTELHCSIIVQYEKGADTNEPRTNEIPFDIKD